MRGVVLDFLHPGRQEQRAGNHRVLITPDFGSGCRVEVRIEGGQPVQVTARRGLTTSNEVYWVETTSGALLITDHFGRAVQEVPANRRRIPPDAVLDHLLFRTTPGTGTCLEGVGRLGHGEQAIWETPGWQLVRNQVDRQEFPAATGFEEGVERVEAALRRAAGDQEGLGPGSRVNLLSGGVDSTLLHTFLGPDVATASAGIDSPEFAIEVEYAKAAASLLGTRHRYIGIAEPEYPDRLHECVRSSGLPPHHLQTVLLDLIFRAATPGTAFITAQFADGLFGLDRAAPALRMERLGAAAALVVPGSRLPGRLGARLAVARHVRQALRRRPNDPDSYAAGFAVYGDRAWTERAFGAAAVRRRLAARIEHLSRLAPTTEWASPTTAAQLTLGHLLDFWLDDTVSVWRQVAHARGVSLAAPFTHPAVVQAALSLDPLERYQRRGVAKPALKALLARRLPSYPIHQPKGASGLPAGRMLDGGVLSGVGKAPIEEVLRSAGGTVPLPRGGNGHAGWAALSLGLWWETIATLGGDAQRDVPGTTP